jgi:RNA polymerase sigma factor for flagellar operon FliA
MKANAARTGLKLVERPKDVEASLWRRLRFEDQSGCRELLFNWYHGLARIIALHEFRRRPPYGLERKDFDQLAYGGLLEAIDRFDPLRGTPFEAYARHRIRGAISDGLAQSNEIAAQYSCRRRAEMERAGSVAPERVDSADSIAELTDMAALLAIGFIAESDRISDTEAGLDAYGTLAWREMQLSILQEIDRLPQAEKSVVQQHYLNGVEFKHIAEILGFSKGRVSQLHRAAMERLRARLRYSE